MAMQMDNGRRIVILAILFRMITAQLISQVKISDRKRKLLSTEIIKVGLILRKR